MPTDPLDQLRTEDPPVRPRPEFVRELGDALRTELAPLLVVVAQPTQRHPDASARTTAVAPSLGYRDAPAAIAWLREVLGFRVIALFEDPDGAIAHARLGWQDGTINVSTRRDGGRMPATGRASTVLTARDRAAVEDMYAHAVALGALVVVPIEDTPYGSRGFSLEDPEGHLWNISTPWLDTDAARRMPQRRV